MESPVFSIDAYRNQNDAQIRWFVVGNKREVAIYSDHRATHKFEFETRFSSAAEEKDSARVLVKRVLRFLHNAKSQLRFTELVLVAEPSFLGALRSGISKDLKKMVFAEIHHEIPPMSSDEMRAFLYKSMKFDRGAVPAEPAQISP